jgi:low affinity Fe/Cu permease
MTHRFRQILTTLGVSTSHPAAFVVVIIYVGAWLVVSPASFDWHAVATVATWLMTLIIQRAEHRDTQAIHAKLDELLRVEGRARSELTELDDEEPEVIKERRLQERRSPEHSLQPSAPPS